MIVAFQQMNRQSKIKLNLKMEHTKNELAQEEVMLPHVLWYSSIQWYLFVVLKSIILAMLGVAENLLTTTFALNYFSSTNDACF